MEALWTYAKHLAPYKCFGMPGETVWWPIAATPAFRRLREEEEDMSSKAFWATLWVLGQPRLAVRPFSQETCLERLDGRTQVEVQSVLLDSYWLFNLVMNPRILIWNTLHISEFPRFIKIGAQCVMYCVTSSIAVPHIQTHWVILLGMKYTNADIGQLWQYMKPWVSSS